MGFLLSITFIVINFIRHFIIHYPFYCFKLIFDDKIIEKIVNIYKNKDNNKNKIIDNNKSDTDKIYMDNNNGKSGEKKNKTTRGKRMGKINIV